MNVNAESETIKGVIENVVYHNENNDYTVLEIVDGNNDLVVAVGTIPMAFEGENVTFSGLFHVFFACFTTILPILHTFKIFGKVGILPARPHKKQL